MRELIIHDRDAARSHALLGVVSVVAEGRARAGAPEPAGCDMVCNASSAGMDDGDERPVAATLLAPSMFVGDVISGHGTTPFLRAAQAAGCRTANGDRMVEALQEIMLDFMLQSDL